jgi:CRISPR system Cascade subunit CasE
MHATLCRAFFPQATKCAPGTLLWRLEPETDAEGRARVLIQSREMPDWSRIPVPEWLAKDEPGKILMFDAIQAGQTFRFRLRANPCHTVQGKRQGLFHSDAQRNWLERKGEQHGFALPKSVTPDYFDFIQSAQGHTYPDVRIAHEQMLKGNQHGGNKIRVLAVLFEGRLTVTDPAQFRGALQTGIGHGKVMGLGLLSIVPTQIQV